MTIFWDKVLTVIFLFCDFQVTRVLESVNVLIEVIFNAKAVSTEMIL